MIKLEVINNQEQHFLITSDEPCRIEVSLIEGKYILADCYAGIQVDMEQEPIGCYDGTLPDYQTQENVTWDYN